MAPYHHVTASVSHLPCSLPPSQSVICLAPCHQTSQSFDLPSTTTSLHQSVICLAPCHQTSQSFDLPSTTASPHHCSTMSQHHCGTISPRHCISQSFALFPATKSVSHLPCPLPPNQSVICLAPCHQTSQSFDLPYTTASPHHHSTMSQHHCGNISPRHCISQSFALFPATKPVSHLPCPLPPNQSVICLAPCHQTSQSFDLPYTTASPHHHSTMSQHHCGTISPRHCISQSFALFPATKPVSHLPCSLPPNQSVI